IPSTLPWKIFPGRTRSFSNPGERSSFCWNAAGVGRQRVVIRSGVAPAGSERGALRPLVTVHLAPDNARQHLALPACGSAQGPSLDVLAHPGKLAAAKRTDATGFNRAAAAQRDLDLLKTLLDVQHVTRRLKLPAPLDPVRNDPQQETTAAAPRHMRIGGPLTHGEAVGNNAGAGLQF